MAHTVELRRAPYGWGNFRTAPEEREYVLAGDSSGRVGCLSEYNQYFAERGFERVTYKVRDKDGVTWLRNVDLRSFRERRGAT